MHLLTIHFTIAIDTGIPQIPAMPSGVSNDPGSVTLTLSTEEAGTATSTEFFQFIVRAEQVSNGSVSYHLRPIEDYMDRQEVNVVVYGLVGDEQYRFRASASNSFGNSNFSDESSEIRIVGKILHAVAFLDVNVKIPVRLLQPFI